MRINILFLKKRIFLVKIKVEIIFFFLGTV